MKIRILLAVMLLCITAFTSCHKDRPVEQESKEQVPVYSGTYSDTCDKIPPLSKGDEWTYLYKRYGFEWPCSNPNNNDEIAYALWDTTQNPDNSCKCNFGLCIYNLRTHENRMIVKDMPIVYTPSWSVKDWILFGTAGGALYKVKSDGQGLTRVGLGIRGFFPSWSPKGDKFYCTTYLDSPVIADENGNVIKKTILLGANWIDEDNIYTVYKTPILSGVGTYNINTDVFTKHYDLPDSKCTGGITVDEHTLLWQNTVDKQIVLSDLKTKENRVLRTTCGPYNTLTLLHDQKTLVVEIVKDTYHSADTLNRDVSLYKMNLDGYMEKLDIKP